jgi:RNA polymerase sigma-70 factor (ECF subfamily)
LRYTRGTVATGLVEVFRAVRSDAAASEALASALAACVATAEAACAGVTVPTARFVRALAERVPADAAPVAALGSLRAGELYLACGCADGDDKALAMFEARYRGVIERAIAATGAATAERADLAQIVRQRILVGGQDRPPRIAGYTGRGALAAWVRVIAIREVSRAQARGVQAAGEGDDELARRIAPDDPELDYVKRRYRAEFKEAFERAVDGLDSRDRLVLRQHTLDGLGIDQLAALHHIHRATAARWVANAREAVLRATQRTLTTSLRISPDELHSLIRLIRSQLDVSLPRLLADPADR